MSNIDTGKRRSISKLLGVGFATTFLTLLALSIYILSQLEQTSDVSTRVHDLRIPTFETSSSFVNNINIALSSLRGDLILENETQHINNQESWKNIYLDLEKLKELSVRWTNPENNIKLMVIEADIEILANSQRQILNLSHADQKLEATGLLSNVAAPTSEKIIALLNEVVDNQKLLLETDNEALNNKIIKLKQYLLLAFIGAAIFIGWIANSIFKNIKYIENQVDTRNKLIDQNILLASIDMNGMVLEISNKLCRELGGTRYDHIGKQSSFFLDKTDTRIDEINNLLKTGAGWSGEIERINPKGEIKWFFSTIIPPESRGNYNSGYSIILEDISDKKHNEMLSITDKLTGIFNRRHFDIVIEKEILLARRRKALLTLAIIDIDYFKPFNDEYGHPEGDRVLKQVAQSMQNQLQRPDDYIFRIGGEEFAILFTSSDIEQSQNFLEKLRLNVEGLKIPHEVSDVSSSVTISIGAVCCKGENIPPASELYELTDNALYEAKIKRNMVEITGL